MCVCMRVKLLRMRVYACNNMHTGAGAGAVLPMVVWKVIIVVVDLVAQFASMQLNKPVAHSTAFYPTQLCAASAFFISDGREGEVEERRRGRRRGVKDLALVMKTQLAFDLECVREVVK